MANTLKKIKVRDYNAMDACLRNGGFMKDRRAPRGGARNYHQEYLEEFMEYKELVCDFCNETTESLQRIALADGYDRLVTKTPPQYACSVCFTEKEDARLARIAEMVSDGV